MRGTSNANIFFMTVSDNERYEAIKCCTKYKLCVCSHVISPATDKKEFYEAFYKVLDKNLQTFSSDLETRTSTRQIHAIKCKLNSLIEKLRSRNTPRKSPLTKGCLEIIKTYVLYYIFESVLKLYFKYILGNVLILFLQIK